MKLALKASTEAAAVKAAKNGKKMKDHKNNNTPKTIFIFSKWGSQPQNSDNDCNNDYKTVSTDESSTFALLSTQSDSGWSLFNDESSNTKNKMKATRPNGRLSRGGGSSRRGGSKLTNRTNNDPVVGRRTLSNHTHHYQKRHNQDDDYESFNLQNDTEVWTDDLGVECVIGAI